MGSVRSQEGRMCKMYLLFVVVVTVISVVNSLPGGHTGVGGVYDDLQLDADNIRLAKQAAKLAGDIFNDDSLIEENEKRLVRQTVYIPTFFTNNAGDQTRELNIIGRASLEREEEYLTLFRSNR